MFLICFIINIHCHRFTGFQEESGQRNSLIGIGEGNGSFGSYLSYLLTNDYRIVRIFYRKSGELGSSVFKVALNGSNLLESRNCGRCIGSGEHVTGNYFGTDLFQILQNHIKYVFRLIRQTAQNNRSLFSISQLQYLFGSQNFFLRRCNRCFFLH